jgi:hypothetical protein
MRRVLLALSASAAVVAVAAATASVTALMTALSIGHTEVSIRPANQPAVTQVPTTSGLPRTTAVPPPPTTIVPLPNRTAVLKISISGGVCPDGTLKSFIEEYELVEEFIAKRYSDTSQVPPPHEIAPCPDEAAVVFDDATWVRSLAGVDISTGTIGLDNEDEFTELSARIAHPSTSDIDGVWDCNFPCGNGTEYLRWWTTTAFVNGKWIAVPTDCERNTPNQFAADSGSVLNMLTSASGLS